MIITRWHQIGKEALDGACNQIRALRSPDLLGKNWISPRNAEDFLYFVSQHESYAAINLDGSILGGFGIRWTAGNMAAWIYYFLLPDAQNRGLGRALIQHVIAEASLNPSCREIYASCSRKNIKSLRCLANLEFQNLPALSNDDYEYLVLHLNQQP